MKKINKSSKNSFFLFLLVAVPLLGILSVVSSSDLSKLTAQGQLAPGCSLILPSKNEQNLSQKYFSYDYSSRYAALERNTSIQLQASCWGFTDNAVFQWNFGDNACSAWEPKGKITAYTYRNSHTYTKNGDYTVTFSLKEGTKSFIGNFKLGIYDRLSFPGNINLSVGYSSTNPQLPVKEYIISNTNGIPSGNLIGGFTERLCTFSGTNPANLTPKTGDLAFREVVPVNTTGTYLTAYRQYLNEPTAIWNEGSCQLSNITKFYDKFGVKGNVNRLSYKIKGFSLNGASANLNVGMIELATRKAIEYTTTNSCIPK